MNNPQKQTFGADGWPPQAIEILMKMRAAGETLKFIADELGITRSAVAGKVRRLGLMPSKPEPNKRQKKNSPKPRPERKPPTPPEPAPPIIDASAPVLPVPFNRLKHWHCRAIIGERGNGELAMFCGRPVTTRVTGLPSSWCADHYEIYMDLERMNRRHG